jgi:hypothetical protein
VDSAEPPLVFGQLLVLFGVALSDVITRGKWISRGWLKDNSQFMAAGRSLQVCSHLTYVVRVLIFYSRPRGLTDLAAHYFSLLPLTFLFAGVTTTLLPAMPVNVFSAQYPWFGRQWVTSTQACMDDVLRNALLLTNCHLGGLDMKHPCIVLSGLQREVELLFVLFPLHRAVHAVPRVTMFAVVVFTIASANMGYVAQMPFIGGACAAGFAVLTAHFPSVALAAPFFYVLRDHIPLRGGAQESFFIGTLVVSVLRLAARFEVLPSLRPFNAAGVARLFEPLQPALTMSWAVSFFVVETVVEPHARWLNVYSILLGLIGPFAIAVVLALLIHAFLQAPVMSFVAFVKRWSVAMIDTHEKVLQFRIPVLVFALLFLISYFFVYHD